MDAAYDGSVTQVIRFFGSEPGSTKRQSYTDPREGKTPFPSPIPNPLFLPIHFVKIEDRGLPDRANRRSRNFATR